MLQHRHPEPALLALASGHIFSGVSVGASGTTVGEVVFNTAMSGYQEVLSDPSYAQQIVTMTCPQIGNVGVTKLDRQSSRVWSSGLIIRELTIATSNWRSETPLSEYLKLHGVVAIAECDTRALVHVLRDHGAQSGCIMTGVAASEADALRKARAFPGLTGLDLAQHVTTEQPYECAAKRVKSTPHQNHQQNLGCHIAVYDFGVKYEILEELALRGCRVTVLPAKTTIEQLLELSPDGVLFSNGPGDPAACHYAINTARALMAAQLPMLGICLGFQIIALAAGASSYKMKFGHHGANHPVHCLSSKRVAITSQNHNFAIDQDSLPVDFEATHRSLFDGSLQGIKHRHLPILGMQGHPEAAPGPQDMNSIFDDFYAMVVNHKVTSCQKEKI